MALNDPFAGSRKTGRPAGTNPDGTQANPPPLPPDAPTDVVDFVECRSRSLILRSGPISWLPIGDGILGDAPATVSVVAGATPETGSLGISAGPFAVQIPFDSSWGVLRIDHKALPDGVPPDLIDRLDAWTRQLNEWLRANGFSVGAVFEDGEVKLLKGPAFLDEPTKPATTPPVTIETATAEPATAETASPEPETPSIAPQVHLPKDGEAATEAPIQPQIDLVEDLVAPVPAPEASGSDADQADADRKADAAWEAKLREDPDWSPDMGYVHAGDGMDPDRPEGHEQPSVGEALAAALGLPPGEADDDGDDDDEINGIADQIAVAVGAPPRTPRPRRGLQRYFVLLGLLIAVGLGAVIGLPLLSQPSSATSSGTPGSSSPTGAGGPAGSGPGASQPVAAASPACPAAAALIDLAPGTIGNAICDVLSADGPGDFVEYSGSPVKAKPVGDLMATALFRTNIGTALAARFLGLSAKDGGLQCPGAKPAAGGYVGYVIEMTTPIAQSVGANWETGIGYLDSTPPSGTTATPWKGPIADVLAGHNTVYTLRFSATQTGAFGPFRLFYDGTKPDAFFLEAPSGACTYVNGNVLVGFIPSAEWDGAKDYRFFSYYALPDNSNSGVDEAPDPSKLAYTTDGTTPTIDLQP